MAGMTICLSYVVITGYVGQVSLMQVALAGASGFVVSHLAQDAGIAFPLGAIAGTAFATVLGFVAGASALRVRGVSLAVVTLAAAVAIEQFGFVELDLGGGGDRLAGARAHARRDRPRAARRLPRPRRQRAEPGARLRRARRGDAARPARRSCAPQRPRPPHACRALQRAGGGGRRASTCATRSSPPGRSPSFIAGVGGTLYGYSLGSVSAERFGIVIALGFVAFAYVGGITMVSGAVIGGLLATSGLIPHVFEAELGISGTWTLLVAGVTLIANLVMFPDGIAGSREQKKKKKVEARREPTPAAGARRWPER